MAIATAVAVRVELGSSFLNPVVVASRTSAVGVGAAAARIMDMTATGFDLAVQETVDPDGFAPEVGVSSASHLGAQVALSGQWGLASAPWREPAALSDRMRSRRGWRYLLDAGFGARLEGDMSRNAEIGYSTEDLRWSAFDGAQEIWRDAPV